jgi:hypothetical protein
VTVAYELVGVLGPARGWEVAGSRATAHASHADKLSERGSVAVVIKALVLLLVVAYVAIVAVIGHVALALTSVIATTTSTALVEPSSAATVALSLALVAEGRRPVPDRSA